MRSRLLFPIVLVLAAGCESTVAPASSAGAPIALSASIAAGGGDITIVDLGTLGGCCSVANAINEAGQVVGYSTTVDNRTHAFLWDNGTMIDLGHLGRDFSRAMDIDDAGRVVGDGLSLDGIRGFVWENGTMTVLEPLPGGSLSTALAINGSGRIVGSSDESGIRRTRAVFWENGTPTSINQWFSSGARGINDLGQIVGSFNTGAFVWDAGVATVLSDPGGIGYNDALDINGPGQIVGSSYDGTRRFGVLWDGGTAIDLGSLGSGNTQARAINDAGHIVGESANPTDPAAGGAFIWVDGTMTALGTLDGAYSGAMDINESGQVVGWSTVGVEEFEHATMWILGPATPEETIDAAVEDVQQFVTAGTLTEGEATAVVSKLDGAAAMIAKGNEKAATNLLLASINQLDALVRSGRLTEAEARSLIDAIQGAVDQMNA